MPRKMVATKYPQQKFGMSYHWMFLLGMKEGIFGNHFKSDILQRDQGPRQFVKGNHYTIYGPGYVWVRMNHQRWPKD